MTKSILLAASLAALGGCGQSTTGDLGATEMMVTADDLAAPAHDLASAGNDLALPVADLAAADFAAADFAVLDQSPATLDQLGPTMGDMTAPTCGAAGLACCPNALCSDLAICQNNVCIACGAAGLPCCGNRTCSDMNDVCNGGGLCVPCGQAGGPCCANGDCGTNCCVNNQCVGAGQSCGGQLGACAMGKCANCGGPGQPCCNGACQANDATCMGNLCVQCGSAGQPCCANQTCLGGNAMCANNVCVACGIPGGPCCANNACSQGCCTPVNGRFGCVAAGANCFAGDLCQMNHQCAGCGALGLSCCANNVCPKGVNCLNNLCGIPASCAALKASNAMLPSGPYNIDSDGAGPNPAFAVYCDMDNDGGGWALAAKIDGNANTFLWNAVPWSDMSTQGTNDLAATEAKLPAFNGAPMTQIRVVVSDGGVSRAAVVTPANLPANATLRSIFASGIYYPTTLTRPGWLALLASGSLQTNCGREGLNVQAPGISLRLGILGNNEDDCNSCDSSIGMGAVAYAAGNIASAPWDDSGAGGRMTHTFNFVWIR